MSFILYLIALVAAIALCVVAFLIVAAGDLAKFKNIHEQKPTPTVLPIISRYGDLINSPQDLDFHLNMLKNRLREKYSEMEGFKNKLHTRMESVHKFQNFKKGCMEMQASLVKVEEECADLQDKIEYFKEIQLRINEDMMPGNSFMGDADFTATPSIMGV